MSTITVGSGLGGFTAIAPQPSYGGAFVPPTRPIYGLKSNKATHDPHIVQGGPYLEYGRLVDIGAAHVQTWQDAKGTLVTDAMSSGLALLLASAFGSASQLVANPSPAFELTNLRPEGSEAHNGNLWSSSQEYLNNGEVVLEGTTFYENIKGEEGNKNKKPSSEATYWKAVPVWSAKVWNVGEKVTVTPGGGKAVVYTCIQKTGAGGEKPDNPSFWVAQNAQSGFCFDMQLGVPTSAGELTPWNYHSCVITKAELVFERTGLVACTFDWDAQYVETTSALVTPTMSVAAEPFSMGNTNSVFTIGAPGALGTLPGVRKITCTLEHKFAVDRIYLGEEHKQAPSSNGLIDIMVTAEMDYTTQAKNVLATFLKNEPQGLKAKAVGAAIGTAGAHNELEVEMTNGFIQTGGEAPLDGPDIVKNTVQFKATINSTNEVPFKGKLVTADTTF